MGKTIWDRTGDLSPTTVGNKGKGVFRHAAAVVYDVALSTRPLATATLAWNMCPDNPEPLTEQLTDTGVELGTVVGDKYRVEKILGAGAKGVVVAALHLALDERVALKLLNREDLRNDPNTVKRFLREAKAAFKIKGEHVARATDVGTLDSGAPYIVMEYLEGRDLGELIAKDGPQPVATSVEYVLQASEAVAQAHILGIIHRDLKPANLFLTQRVDGSNCIKVLDFGISKLRSSTDATATSTDEVFGSPAYMSPEQWVSSTDVDMRSDIWSLGGILYELLTGKLPFSGDGIPQLYNAVMMKPPPPIGDCREDVPAAIEKIILKCLEKVPEDRYQNVAELAAELAPFGTKASRLLARRILRALSAAGLAQKPLGIVGDSELPAPMAVAAGSEAAAVSTDPTPEPLDAPPPATEPEPPSSGSAAPTEPDPQSTDPEAPTVPAVTTPDPSAPTIKLVDSTAPTVPLSNRTAGDELPATEDDQPADAVSASSEIQATLAVKSRPPPQPASKAKWVIAGLVVIVLLAGGWWLRSSLDEGSGDTSSATAKAGNTASTAPTSLTQTTSALATAEPTSAVTATVSAVTTSPSASQSSSSSVTRTPSVAVSNTLTHPPPKPSASTSARPPASNTPKKTKTCEGWEPGCEG